MDAELLEARPVSGLGDAGVPGGGSDQLYTGETGGGVFSLDYYRQKITDFQVTLQAVDQAANGAYAVLMANDVDQELNEALGEMLNDFEAHKSQLRYTAEAINAGAAMMNAAGGRMPQLSIPSGLGLGPLVIPAGFIAAIAVITPIVIWGHDFIQGLNDRLKQSNILDRINDPVKRDQAALGMAAANNAVAVADSTTSGTFASALKWIAIAAAGLMAWKIYQDSQKKGA